MAVTEVAEITEVAKKGLSQMWQEVPARNRKVLTLGASAGMVTGSLLLGLQSGPDAVAGGGTVGAVLGVAASALLLALNSKPLLVMCVLLAIAPLASIAGALTGFGPLGVALGALAAFATAWLAMYPRGRAGLTPDLATCAVIVYALLMAFGLRNIPPNLLLPLACGSLLPMSLFFAGMMLPGLATPDSSAQEQAQLGVTTPFARALRWLVIAAFVGSFALALIVVGLAQALPAMAPALPTFDGPLAEVKAMTVPLAHVFGLTLVVLLTWDSRGLLWRTLLGPGRVMSDAVTSRWSLLWRVLFVALAFGSPLLLIELALLWSRATLVGVGVALLWASVVRRRYGAMFFVALLALPVISVLPYGAAGWLGTLPVTADTIINGAAWQSALTGALATPLGSGFSLSDFSPTIGTQYFLTLRTLGLPGFVALLSLLLITLVRVWRARRRLRLLSGEAGAIVVAGALLLFIAMTSLTTSPLTEPATALLFWLFLGLANGVVNSLDKGVAPASVARDYPLRVAYVLHSGDEGETPLALFDLLQALDRRHVTPLLVSLGQAPLIAHARNLQISLRVVSLPDPNRPRLALQWSTSQLKLLRWLAGTGLVYRLLAQGDRLIDAWNNLGQWIGVIRALWDLRPDLIVSNSATTHLPTLAFARLSGVPVSWHLRERAPAQMQTLLNTLIPWTAGAVTTSQALARSFNLDLLSHLVRVVRPGVVLPEPITSQRRAELRRTLNIPEGATVLAYPGLPSSVSGHLEMLRALLALAKRYPGVHLVLAHEEMPALESAPTETMGLAAPQSRARQFDERMRQTMGKMGGLVTWIGKYPDLSEIFSVCDMVVLPVNASSSTRTLLLAMASGTPIIAPRADEIKEQLAGAWGYKLVDSAKPDALEESIGEMLHNLEHYQSQARRNPGVVRDWFTSTLEAGRLVTVYHGLCLPSKPLQARRLLPHRKSHYPQEWLTTLQQLTAEG